MKPLILVIVSLFASPTLAWVDCTESDGTTTCQDDFGGAGSASATILAKAQDCKISLSSSLSVTNSATVSQACRDGINSECPADLRKEAIAMGSISVVLVTKTRTASAPNFIDATVPVSCSTSISAEPKPFPEFTPHSGGASSSGISVGDITNGISAEYYCARPTPYLDGDVLAPVAATATIRLGKSSGDEGDGMASYVGSINLMAIAGAGAAVGTGSAAATLSIDLTSASMPFSGQVSGQLTAGSSASECNVTIPEPPLEDENGDGEPKQCQAPQPVGGAFLADSLSDKDCIAKEMTCLEWGSLKIKCLVYKDKDDNLWKHDWYSGRYAKASPAPPKPASGGGGCGRGAASSGARGQAKGSVCDAFAD